MTADRWWPVAGRSMWPLCDGMAVRVCSAVNISLGDLVVFIAADRATVFAHRVVDRRGTHVITRGDTNACADPAVPLAALIGRVDAIRWRRWQVGLPATGAVAELQRALGVGWSRVAPGLRDRWRRLHKV